MSTTTPAPRLRLLDGLRIAAAIGVILYHYTGRYPSQVADFGWFAYVTTYAAVGVYLFFMISGFVILMTAWGRDLPNYIGSRVGRLFPTYWAAVLIAGLIVFALRPSFPADPAEDLGWDDWALNFTMVHSAFGAENSDGIYWTLYMELKFYVLIALFMLIGITRHRILAFVLIWPVLGALAQQNGGDVLAEILMPHYAPLFSIGMVLYLVHLDGRFRPDTTLALGFNLAFMAYQSNGPYAAFMTRTDDITASGGIIAVILLFGVLTIWAFSCTRLQYVRWGWLTTAGALTYPLYLIHERLGWYVIEVLQRHDWAAWPAMLAAVATVFAAAYLLYRCVDVPFSGRLRRAVEHQLRSLVPASRDR